MKKWGILALLVAGCLSGAAEENGFFVKPMTERPNILFCLADDRGWPAAGAYGDEVVRMPSFEQLVKEGGVFERAFVSSTSCRSSILTGQQFFRLGASANLRGPLDVNHPNFMFFLRESGCVIGHGRKARDQGNYDEGGYTEHLCGPETTFPSFMDQRDKNTPFCFRFGSSDPHLACDQGTGAASGLDLAKIHVLLFFPDTPAVRSDIADYYYKVERRNRDVGEALKLLEERGELENTIVVMTGDHGMPFPRCKGNMYDRGLRVPLAVRKSRRSATRFCGGRT